MEDTMTTGSVDATPTERRRLTRLSHEANAADPVFRELYPDLLGISCALLSLCVAVCGLMAEVCDAAAWTAWRHSAWWSRDWLAAGAMRQQ
jgi:hypothetical protein